MNVHLSKIHGFLLYILLNTEACGKWKTKKSHADVLRERNIEKPQGFLLGIEKNIDAAAVAFV